MLRVTNSSPHLILAKVLDRDSPWMEEWVPVYPGSHSNWAAQEKVEFFQVLMLSKDGGFIGDLCSEPHVVVCNNWVYSIDDHFPPGIKAFYFTAVLNEADIRWWGEDPHDWVNAVLNLGGCLAVNWMIE
ncbi:hypothetical protein GGI12_004703 [Dipsacomyces acuminosporus]|nr:hypothetical protein GGI12_004703 [Dipsacomyces acuminosporus]